MARSRFALWTPRVGTAAAGRGRGGALAERAGLWRGQGDHQPGGVVPDRGNGSPLATGPARSPTASWRAATTH